MFMKQIEKVGAHVNIDWTVTYLIEKCGATREEATAAVEEATQMAIQTPATLPQWLAVLLTRYPEPLAPLADAVCRGLSPKSADRRERILGLIP